MSDEKIEGNIFELSEEKAKESAKRFCQFPYGRNVIAAMAAADLKKRCNAGEKDVIQGTSMAPFTKDTWDKMGFLLWMDADRSNVSEEVFKTEANKIAEEIEKFVPNSIVVIKIARGETK